MGRFPLPALPAPLSELPDHVDQSPVRYVVELFEPYRTFEAALRRLYVQAPDNKALRDPYINVVPIFGAAAPEIRVRVRNLEAESREE